MGLSGCLVYIAYISMSYFFIGDAELLSAFRIVGIEGQAVTNPREARSAFNRITKGIVEGTQTSLPVKKDYKVVILTQEVASWMDDLIQDWQLGAAFPLLVEIPGLLGPLEGRKTLLDAIREAIGVRV